MLNIFLKKRNNNNFNNNNKNNLDKKINSIGYARYFPPINNEWYDSIYVYNKNSLKHLPVYNTVISGLIESHFNLYDTKYETQKTKMTRRMRVRIKRLSGNRVFASKAQVKYMNSKIIITSNIYDACQRFLNKKFNKLIIKTEMSKRLKYLYVKKFYNIKNICLKILKRTMRKNKFIIKQIIKSNKLSKITLIKYYLVLLQYNKLKKRYINLVWKRYIKFLKKEMLALHFNNLINFQKSKFYKTNILNNLIEKIYNKKIEFNFINLKYVHLDSDIFGEFLLFKLKKNKIKRRPEKILDLILKSNSFKVPFISELYKKPSLKNYYKRLLLKKTNSFNINSFFLIKRKFLYSKDKLNNLLKKIYLKKNKVFHNIENKAAKGIRIKLKGRTSTRLSADRSTTKIKNKGSLKNINSSYKGLSCVVLKGYAGSNIQYMKKNSVTRTGSFGMKIWISSV